MGQLDPPMKTSFSVLGFLLALNPERVFETSPSSPFSLPAAAAVAGGSVRNSHHLNAKCQSPMSREVL